MAIDLTGQFFNIAQDQIEEGQLLNLDFSVINRGSEDVDPFSFDIVISRDNEISEDDFKLGNYEIRDGLRAGEDSGLKSFGYFTPAADHPFWLEENGTYTVGIRIDPENEFFESNEDNNSNVSLGVDSDQFEIVDFAPSDLKGEYLSVIGDREIIPGEEVNLSFGIENDSTEIANPFSIDIYISPEADYAAEGAIKIGTYDIRNTIAGGNGTGEKRFSYKTPELGDALWEKGDGTYYIAFDIDSQDVVSETNEDNNSGQGLGLDSAEFNVTGVNNAADLVVTNFQAPVDAKAGDTVTVEYEITNQGGSEADLFAAGFYLFGEDYLTNNDHLSVEDVPEVFFLQGDRDDLAISLGAGESTGMVSTEITLPETWAGYSGNGDYYLGVEADPFDDVVESSDINNSLTEEMVDYQKITLEAPVNNTVDLVGTHFEVVQDQIVPGQQFDLGFTVANEGMAEVDPFYFELYLSQDEDINPEEDYYLGRYDIRDGLPGNDDIGLKSSRYTAPDAENPFWGEGDGAYYAGMIIDPANDIVETNEDNNSNVGDGLDYAQTSVTGLGTVADLKTNGSFNVVPETIDTGATFEVTYDIFNEGTESADLFAAGFFIFTEDYLMNNDALSVEDVPQVYFIQGDREDLAISLDPATGTGVVTTELTMPTDWDGFALGSGEYYIGVAADVYDDIVESDEMNNSLVGEFIDYEKVNINVTSTDI
ncbi:MAG: CARDB domain-containing protein [Pleurocapsa sp. MO_226.B13]|nr:CARDB domain-containing protein [Pleurocapsa sp. MO_226.B13]